MPIDDGVAKAVYQALGIGIPHHVQTFFSEALDVLMHDGYLIDDRGSYRFEFPLLKDWWANRFRDHYIPLASRFPDQDG